MCRAIRLQPTAQKGFDLVAHRAVVLRRKLHADTGNAIALRALGRDPHDLAGHGNFFSIFHQRQQHEHFIAEVVGFIGGNEPVNAKQKYPLSALHLAGTSINPV